MEAGAVSLFVCEQSRECDLIDGLIGLLGCCKVGAEIV